MSGTSLDAVDAALILTNGETVEAFGPVVERKYSSLERNILEAATDAARDWKWQGPKPDAKFAGAIEVGTQAHKEAFLDLVSLLPEGTNIAYAGVHGQTVLHRRPTSQQKGATLQLCDGEALAKAFDVPVICDFRSADVAAGGQGAPLAPAYHGALLRRLGKQAAVVLNLGGVANITALTSDGQLAAFDTGPANGPIDEWVAGHDRGTHDQDGRFALAGEVHRGLLTSLLEHPWFSEPYPKSLDRYDFNASLARGLSLEDGAATLTAFSAYAVAAGVHQLSETPECVIACGGGRHNPALMKFLVEALPCKVLSAEEAGWRGDSIEAEAFAFLAARRVRCLPISWPGTTGVTEPMTGGIVVDPN